MGTGFELVYVLRLSCILLVHVLLRSVVFYCARDKFVIRSMYLFCYLSVVCCLLVREWVPPERVEGRGFGQHRRRGIVAGHLPPRALHASGEVIFGRYGASSVGRNKGLLQFTFRDLLYC